MSRSSRCSRKTSSGTSTASVAWRAEAFGGEIENAGIGGGPELTVDRLIEEGDTMAAPYLGKVERGDGGWFSFAATDVFTFDGDLISHVESYVVVAHT